MENHNLKRGVMIGSFAALERWINLYISQHYIKESPRDHFVSEVLESPYFSAQLRKQILSSILEGNKDKKSIINDLEELQSLRNLVAHSSVIQESTFNEVTGQQEESGPFYQKYGGKRMMRSELEPRFDELCSSLLIRIGALVSNQSKEHEASHQLDTEKEIHADTQPS